MSNATAKPATAKQLRYLRALANKTGTTFTRPVTSREASREIARMRSLTPRVDTPTDRDAEARYATAPAEEEIAGYGIDAHWRHTNRPTPRNGTPRSSPPNTPAPRRRVTATVLATHQTGGAPRQVLSIPVGSGRLIVDRLTAGGDARLLARLDPDEPPENATLIARMYVADPRRPRCRPVTRADLEPPSSKQAHNTNGIAWQAPLIAGIGARFQIQAIPSDRGTCLRWTEHEDGDDSDTQTVSLRHVLGRLESYQPAVAMTSAAIRAHEKSETSTATLKSELARLESTPIVLNRRLREHVKQATDTNGVTMSVIALRCGRIKRDPNGRESGETSWLARRIGVAPEAGAPRPTPWIHTDVLALIARDGLGIAPAEAELTLT